MNRNHNILKGSQTLNHFLHPETFSSPHQATNIKFPSQYSESEEILNDGNLDKCQVYL